jgi:hypothetical protein
MKASSTKIRLMVALMTAGLTIGTTFEPHVSYAQGMTKKDAITIDGGGFFCLNDLIEPNGQNSLSQEYYIESDGQFYYATYANNSSLTCKKKRELEILAGGAAISLHMISVALACTGLGASFALGVEVAALGVHVLEFSISNLDCRDTEEEEEIEALVEDRICSVLTKNGIKCDPENLERKLYTPINEGRMI